MGMFLVIMPLEIGIFTCLEPPNWGFLALRLDEADPPLGAMILLMLVLVISAGKGLNGIYCLCCLPNRCSCLAICDADPSMLERAVVTTAANPAGARGLMPFGVLNGE